MTIPKGQLSADFDDNFVYGEFFSVGTSVMRNSNPTINKEKIGHLY